MPELPEIITIRNDLRKEVLGKKIVVVKTSGGWKFEEAGVVGHKIEEITNIAKLLLFRLSSGKYIAAHLNISGVLLFNTTDPWVRVTLELENGDKLYYSDTRMFGVFEVWPAEKVNEYKLYSGKTIIESDLSKEEFGGLIKKQKRPIKQVLLDRKVIGGIGNIYADDALYMSRIHPKRKAADLSDKELETLFDNLQLILNEGIAHRGSTIDRYRDLYGKPGTQQNYFRIYGKKGQKCPNCQNPIIYEKMQGRPTYYCETCQPPDTRPRLL